MRSTRKLRKAVTKRQQRNDGRPRRIQILLTPHSELPVPAWRADALEPEPEPSAPSVTVGQRPRQPTEADAEAAREVLRDRARRGLYVGGLPPSAADLRAEHDRQEALQRDAVLLRLTGSRR